MTLSHGQVCEALLAERRWELDGAGPQRWTDFQGLECGQIKKRGAVALRLHSISHLSLSLISYIMYACVYINIKNNNIILYNINYTI